MGVSVHVVGKKARPHRDETLAQDPQEAQEAQEAEEAQDYFPIRCVEDASPA